MKNPVYQISCGWVFNVADRESFNVYITEQEAREALEKYLKDKTSVPTYSLYKTLPRN